MKIWIVVPTERFQCTSECRRISGSCIIRGCLARLVVKKDEFIRLQMETVDMFLHDTGIAFRHRLDPLPGRCFRTNQREFMPVEIRLLIDLQRKRLEVKAVDRQTQQLAEPESKQEQRQKGKSEIRILAATIQFMKSIDFHNFWFWLLPPDRIIPKLVEQEHGVETVAVMCLDPSEKTSDESEFSVPGLALDRLQFDLPPGAFCVDGCQMINRHVREKAKSNSSGCRSGSIYMN